MTKTLRAIRIDPFLKTVTAFKFPAGDDPKAFHDAIGHGCDCFTTVRLPDWNHKQTVIFLDDVGLYRDDQRFFALPTLNEQPLAGVGIVLGIDEEGGTIGTELPLALLERLITWPDIAFAGLEHEPPREDDGPFGRFTVLSSRAVFRPRNTN